MTQAKYFLNHLINLPLLPVLFYQAKKIRESVPRLPEASGPRGFVENGENTIRLLGIGESTVAGVGIKQHTRGFTGQVAKLLAGTYAQSVDWQVIAKSGYTAKHVRQKLLPKILDQSADLIMIGLGGNDTFKMTPPATWRHEIELMLDKLEEKFPETPVIFIELPPIRSLPAFTGLAKFVLGRHLDLLQEELIQITKKRRNVHYSGSSISLEQWLHKLPEAGNSTQVFFSDGVHPSELAYQVLAKETVALIQARSILEA